MMTEKYKSLLYREWKVSKKFYLLRIVLLLLFTALLGGTVLFLMNASTGPEAEAGVAEALDWTLIFFFYLLVLFMAAASGEDNGVYKSDVSSGWLKYSWALPVTAHEKAVTKYVFRGILILAGTIYMFASVGAICAITGFAHMKTVVYAFFWCLDAILATYIVRDYIVMNAVDMKALKKMGNIAIIVFVIVFELPAFMRIIRGVPPEEILDIKLTAMINAGDYRGLVELISIPDLWGCIGILLLVVIFVGGFLLSRKNFERRNA